MTPEERRAWLASRRQGIGASDVAKAATGRYGGALSVVADKIGLAPVDPIDPELADRGHRWEQPVADSVHALTGLFVAGEQLPMIHPANSRHRCTVDGLLLPNSVATMAEVVGGLEVKTRAPRGPWPWDYYRAQAHWSMHVTGLRRWLVAVATIDNDYDAGVGRLVEQATGVTYAWVDHDPAAIAQLVELADWLWAYVERRELPEPSDAGGLEVVKAANIEANPAASADIDDLAELIARREKIRDAVKAAEEEARYIEARIRHRMGDAMEATTSDGTWRVRCGLPVRRFTDESEADFLDLFHAEAEGLGLVVPKLDRARAKTLMGSAYDSLRRATPDRRLTVKQLAAEAPA